MGLSAVCIPKVSMSAAAGVRDGGRTARHLFCHFLFFFFFCVCVFFLTTLHDRASTTCFFCLFCPWFLCSAASVIFDANPEALARDTRSEGGQGGSLECYTPQEREQKKLSFLQSESLALSRQAPTSLGTSKDAGNSPTSPNQSNRGYSRLGV